MAQALKQPSQTGLERSNSAFSHRSSNVFPCRKIARGPCHRCSSHRAGQSPCADTAHSNSLSTLLNPHPAVGSCNQRSHGPYMCPPACLSTSTRTCSRRFSRGTCAASAGSYASSGSQPEDAPPDEVTMAIFSAQSWEQLYDLYYGSTAAPSYQHCYSCLIALSELLPELDQPPPTAVTAAGLPGGSSGGGSDLDSGWEALRAAGKVVSWNQLTALRGLIRDLVKCVESHLRSFSTRQLVDLLQAVCQLSHPPPRWLQSWQEAVVGSLKGLSVRELTTAAEVMLLHDVQPSKPWAGLWCVAMEKHLVECSQQQLSLASLAVTHWGIKPPPSWAKPYAQALQTHLHNMSPAELLVCISAAVLMGLKLAQDQQQLLCNVTLGQLQAVSNNSDLTNRSSGVGSAEEWPAARLLQLLRGCLLLGWQPSAEWLSAWVAAVQHQISSSSSSGGRSLGRSFSFGGSSSSSSSSSEWDLAAVAQVLTALSSAKSAAEALAAAPTAATAAGSNRIIAEAVADSSSSGFLQFLVQYTQPLIESQPNPAPLVELLWGFEALHYTPPDEYLDLLLDEAAVKLQDSSNALLQQHYPHGLVSSSSSSNSSRGSESSSFDSSSSKEALTDGELGSSYSVADWDTAATESSSSSDSRQSSSSSSSTQEEDSSTAQTSKSETEGEQVWSTLEAGAYKPSANITLARRHLESSWSMKVTEHPSVPPPPDAVRSSSSSSNSSSGAQAQGAQAGAGSKNSRANSSSSSSNSSNGMANGSSSAKVPSLPPQPPSTAAIAASSSVVRQALQLLSCVAAMRLPVEPEWVTEVLQTLRGHFVAVGLPEFQQLLLLRELLGGNPEPEWVDELLTECTVSPRDLTDPLDQLHLLSLLASSQTRPNNMWWQAFLSTCQDSLTTRYSPAQHVMLLALLADLGGRPPQSWLAAHEASLLAAHAGGGAGGQALGLEGWLLLLQCYGKLMYKPSHSFESVFECHAHGLLQSMGAGDLASLVSSVARLQLPLSPMLEDGITHRLDKVLSTASADELERLIEGLLLLEVQLPSPTLHNLCSVVQPHLGSFSAPATCCLLQLMSREGEYPPSPRWMELVLAGLEPQLQHLEALPALQLLQSLKEFHTQPPRNFMLNLQARLAHLAKKLDAMGIATMVQGLVACGVNPGLELQRGIARHIKKGLARPSQGMGGTPVWILLGSLLRSANMPLEGSRASTGPSSGSASGTFADASSGLKVTPAVTFGSSGVICSELLDELLLQVAGQLSAGAVSSSRMCRNVLPALAAAFVPGGCWAPPGYNYTPSAGFCAALCEAMLEFQRVQAQVSMDGGAGCGEGEGSGVEELPGVFWLGLLVRFGDMAGFRPGDEWIRVACKSIVRDWGHAAAVSSSSSRGGGSGSIGNDKAVVVSAAAGLDTDVWRAAPAPQFAAWLSAVGRLQHEPVYLPGWPNLALGRLLDLLGQLNGHELSVALLGVAHQQQSAEMAAAGVLLPSSSSSSSMLAALAAVKPQLLAAAEAASYQHLSKMDAADLATIAHALQQLDHTPAPAWVDAWAACVAAQLPGCSAAAAVWQLAALAGSSARPSADLIQGLVSRCQAGLGQLEVQELLGLTRALQMLGYRPEALLLEILVRAGQAAAVRAKGMGGSSGQQLREQMLSELQQLAVLLAD